MIRLFARKGDVPDDALHRARNGRIDVCGKPFRRLCDQFAAQDALSFFHDGNSLSANMLQERDVYRIGFGTSPNFFTCRERFAPFRMHAV